ncbi:MAG: hypothetical protein CM1200mP41_37190 [Gammaproteobacteria bacterium]|nr:MAG: hypothetical protein CM1200mP41_37190 [Gammaproteobacteria bacterium]
MWLCSNGKGNDHAYRLLRDRPFVRLSYATDYFLLSLTHSQGVFNRVSLCFMPRNDPQNLGDTNAVMGGVRTAAKAASGETIRITSRDQRYSLLRDPVGGCRTRQPASQGF